MVDNGQHLLMGCYHTTLRFLREIGTLERIAIQPSLKMDFVDVHGRHTTLECPKLAAPWHVIAGVLRSNAFGWSEKVQIARLGRAIKRQASSSALTAMTVEDWLTGQGQSERAKRGFWDLLSIAALNEDPRRASAAVFARVLQRALFTSSTDSCLALPRAGLSECYTEAAKNYIEARGGTVEVGCRVESLIAGEGVCYGVQCSPAKQILAPVAVLAVPWHEAVKLLPPNWLRDEPYFTNILALSPAPIISIHIWFDRAITALDFAGLRGTTIQWLFNRARLASSTGHCYSLVLSGAHEHVAKPKDELLKVALEDLAKLFPVSRAAKVLHSLVIKERHATFSPGVGIDGLRPAARSPIRGLYLAGDWTATGLPATIEGAVQSGYTAAELILKEQ
jgi:squalene-associated FAD-dependent desaturase